MKLQTFLSIGCYNWCKPSEKSGSLSCRILECSNAPASINLHIDYDDIGAWKRDLEKAPIDTIIELIKWQKQRFSFSSSFGEQDIFSKFINEHYTELHLSAKQDRLLEIEKKLSELSEEKVNVIKTIKSCKDELQLVDHFLEEPFIPY